MSAPLAALPRSPNALAPLPPWQGVVAILRFLMQYFVLFRWLLIGSVLCLIAGTIGQALLPPVIPRLLILLPIPFMLLALLFGFPAGIRLFAGTTRTALLPGAPRAILLACLLFALIPVGLVGLALWYATPVVALPSLAPLFLLMTLNTVAAMCLHRPLPVMFSKFLLIALTLHHGKQVAADPDLLIALQPVYLLLAVTGWMLFYRWLRRQRRLPTLVLDAQLSERQQFPWLLQSLLASGQVRDAAQALLIGSSDRLVPRLRNAALLVYGLPLAFLVFLAVISLLFAGRNILASLDDSLLPVMLLSFALAMQGYIVATRARNARQLWLRVGGSRGDFLLQLERSLLLDLGAVACFALLATLGFVLLGQLAPVHVVPGIAGWLAATLTGSLLVLNVLARSSSVTLAAIAQIAPLLLAAALILVAVFATETSFWLVTGLMLALAPLLRLSARRAWQNADLHRLRPLAAGLRPAG